MYIPYLVGVYAFKHKEKLKEIALFIACTTAVVFFFMFYNWTYEMASASTFKIYKYLSLTPWHQISIPLYSFIYKLVMGLCGSLFIISLFIFSAKYIPNIRIGMLFGKWGSMTLGIYLCQAIILEHMMMRLINLSSMNWILFNYVVSPIISIVVLGVCIVLTNILKSNKWTAFLFLGIGCLPAKICSNKDSFPDCG